MITHAILLTAPGSAAIAVVRIHGPAAQSIAAQLAPAAARMEPGTFQHAILRHEKTVLDDALLLRTADQTFEIHLHGGRAVIDGVLRALSILGAEITPADSPLAAELAWPGESPISREVLSALRTALTPTAAELLTRQRTVVSAWANGVLQKLDGGAPLWQLQSAMQWLLCRSNELRFALAPPRIAIVGPPNAGKSTLANALLGRPSSITSDTPGTTRDWVDATAIFAAGQTQIAVTLVDTAGIHETGDPIETESIARTHQQAAAADVVLAVMDGSQPPGDLAWLRHLDAATGRMVIVTNKCDLLPKFDSRRAREEMFPTDSSTIAHALRPRPQVQVSAIAHVNLERLMHAALAELGVAEIGVDEVCVFTDRQRHWVAQAATSDPATLRDCLRALLDGSLLP